MSKKSINIIIALMSFALLGSIVLQAYWIRNAVKIKEEQFEENVFALLRRTGERLEKQEEEDVFKITDFIVRNKKGKRYVEEDLYNAGLDTENQERVDCVLKILNDNTKNDNGVYDESREKKRIYNSVYDCLFSFRDLEDRIIAEDLGNILKKEIKNAGLENVLYTHGAISSRTNRVIIQNGHFYNEVTPDLPLLRQDFDFLRNTKYKLDLFTTDQQSPGYISVHFPSKTGYVWSSVLATLMSSIIFTGAILFCFAYTIKTIVKQKKLDIIKNDFINNMTHEFKTPIATISLATNTILNPTILNNPDKVKRFAEIILQENKRMNGQVEKVLQAAIVDRSKFQLKYEEIDLHEVIKHAVENFSLQVENRDGFLLTDLKAENSIIEGDLTHITNMVHNLMDNANKYSPEKPEITIRTRNISGGIEFRVEDKGIGLSPASRKMVFDKFFRVSTGNIHDVKGFGLGLSYVKTMVTAHKGNIDVKSDLGKGSTFIIFLPFKVKLENE